jgi:hypothetical protein
MAFFMLLDITTFHTLKFTAVGAPAEGFSGRFGVPYPAEAWGTPLE